MSGSIVGEAIAYSRARPTAKFVLTILANHANADRLAWPGNDLLEALTGLGRSALYEALAELERAGEIVRAESGRGRGRSTTWRITDLVGLYGSPVAVKPKRKAPPAGARPLMGATRDMSAQPDVIQPPQETSAQPDVIEETSGQPDENVRVAGQKMSGSHASAGRNPQRKHQENTMTPTRASSGMSNQQSPGGEYTTRAHALAVGCPRCAAATGHPCRRANGGDRTQFHAERHQRALSLGAPVADVSKAATTQTQRPGPRERGTSQRATGTNLRSLGMSPRQLAAAERQAAEEATIADAVATLHTPDQADEPDWIAWREIIQRAVRPDVWAIWLDGLSLAAVDQDGTFILDCPSTTRGWAQTRFKTLLDEAGKRIGRPGARVASAAESAALARAA